MTTQDPGGFAAPAPAVLYLAKGKTGRFRAASARWMEHECRQRAVGRGLTLLDRTARDPREVDELLKDIPDGAVVVEPAVDDHDELMKSLGDRGTVLEGLLGLGATLRLRDARTTPAPAADRLSDGRAVLLTVDPFGPQPPTAERDRRARECAEYAERRCGLQVGSLIDSRLTYVRFIAEEAAEPARGLVRTFVIHPDALALGTDVGRWLLQGRVVHSAGQLRSSRRLEVRRVQAAPRLSERSESARAASRGHVGSLDNHASGTPPEQTWHSGNAQANIGSAPPAYAYPPTQAPVHLAPSPAGRPLPHDGLFIRRRSAFGTRSVLGVTELIDGGVLIEQDQIRFDDFIAARTDQVPGPAEGEGEALAVSHGLARVPGDSKAHEATTHFVEIALKAGAQAPPEAPAEEPLPVNFVFVVDTSSSMDGEKLDTVKSALQEIYERLRPSDSLGIVTFATDVSTLLQATRKEDLPPERFAATVAGMTAYGGTDIQLGVQYGIAEIGRRASAGRTVNRLYLFSDGDPTSGERNWTTVRKNIAARLRGDLTLSCFGFGTDARMAELSALAGTARGHCTFVTRPEQVRACLLEDLERRDHLAAIDIQLRIDIDPAVTVWHLYGHDLVTDPRARARVFRESREAARRAREEYGTEALPGLITGEKGIRIFAPDLAFGETYWVVLEVQVPEGRIPADGIGTATVQYVDTLARENRSRELVLAEAATLSEETVTVHAVGLRTSEITFHALDDLYENDRDAAGQRLTAHIEVLKQVHQAVPAPEFVADRVTIEKLLVLAGTLGTFAAFSDATVAAAAPTIRGMNVFARVRSGAAF